MRTPLRSLALAAALITVPGSLPIGTAVDHRTLHHQIDSALFEDDLTRASVLLANAWGSLPPGSALDLLNTLPTYQATREEWLARLLYLSSEVQADESREPGVRRRAYAASERLRTEIFLQIQSRKPDLRYLRDTCTLLDVYGPPTRAWVTAYEEHFADWDDDDLDLVLRWLLELKAPDEADRLLAAWKIAHPEPEPEPPFDWDRLHREILTSDEAVIGQIDEAVDLCHRLAEQKRTEELRTVIARIFEADYGDFLLVWNAYDNEDSPVLPEVRRHVDTNLQQLLPDVLAELLEFTEGAPDPIEFGPDHPAHLETRALLIRSLQLQPELLYEDMSVEGVFELLLPSVLAHGWPDPIDEAIRALTLQRLQDEEEPIDRAETLHTAATDCFTFGRRDLCLELLERAVREAQQDAQADTETRDFYRKALQLARAGISPDCVF